MLRQSRLQTIIWTSRLPEAERFYSNVLELPLQGRSDGALVYDVGGSDLRVCPIPSTQPSAHTVMGFAVEGLDSILPGLCAKGLVWERFNGLPHDSRGVVVTPDGSQVVWFRDPDGNLISIVQFAS